MAFTYARVALVISSFAAASAVVISAMAVQVTAAGDDIPHCVSAREGLSLLQVQVMSKTVALPLEPGEISVPVDTRRMGPLGLLHIPYNHVAIDIPYNNSWEQMITFPERRPREFNVILATFKTFAADATVQLVEGAGRSSWRFDRTRSFAFALFGFLYVGCAQWILYVSLLTWLFPDAMSFANSPLSGKLLDKVGQWDMLGQVLVDNFSFNVFIYFPAFYILETLVQGNAEGESLSLPERIQAGFGKYRKNFMADNMASWALWIPCDLFIFAAPMFLRMPLEHGISFGWTMFMSAMRGNDKKLGAETKPGTDWTDTKPVAKLVN